MCFGSAPNHLDLACAAIVWGPLRVKMRERQQKRSVDASGCRVEGLVLETLGRQRGGFISRYKQAPPIPVAGRHPPLRQRRPVVEIPERIESSAPNGRHTC